MPSEFTRMNRDIWSSDEFLDLSAAAQHLYFVLWTHPSLSFCGSVDWHPGKLATRAADLTPELVIEAGIELAQKLFIVVDPDTEEVLVRSWIKHDGLCRQPNMAVAMSKDRANLSSRSLRGVVVHEVAKLRIAEPDLSAWKRDQVLNLLSQNAVDPAELLASNPWLKGSVNPPGNPSGKGSVNPSGNPSLNPSGNPKPKGPVNPGRTTTTATATQTPTTKEEESSYVSPEGNDASANEPPPLHCPRHINEPTTSPCHACGETRRNRQAWDREQSDAQMFAISEETRRRAEIKAVAIDVCELCNEHGYVGTTVCNHDPERFTIARRGKALVDEVLAKKRADAEEPSDA